MNTMNKSFAIGALILMASTPAGAFEKNLFQDQYTLEIRENESGTKDILVSSGIEVKDSGIKEFNYFNPAHGTMETYSLKKGFGEDESFKSVFDSMMGKGELIRFAIDHDKNNYFRIIEENNGFYDLKNENYAGYCLLIGFRNFPCPPRVEIDYKAEYERLEAANDKLNNQLNEVNQQWETYKSKLEDAEKNPLATQEEINRLRDNIATTRDQLNILRGNKEALSNELADQRLRADSLERERNTLIAEKEEAIQNQKRAEKNVHELASAVAGEDTVTMDNLLVGQSIVASMVGVPNGIYSDKRFSIGLGVSRIHDKTGVSGAIDVRVRNVSFRVIGGTDKDMEVVGGAVGASIAF